MRCVAIIFCLLAIVERAHAQNELDKFQGVWQVIKLSSNGVDAPAEQAAKMVIVFKGDQMFPKDNPTDVATIKVDGTKKLAEIDTVDRFTKLNWGIYRFASKDTLEICINITDDAARPKDFVAPKGMTLVIFVLKRMKD